MLITHEADAVLWEGEFDNPEELSWYIVDSCRGCRPSTSDTSGRNAPA